MRIAWVSPLPNDMSEPRSASFTRVLVPWLAEFGKKNNLELALYHNSLPTEWSGHKVYNYLQLRDHVEKKQVDLIIYQIDDVPECQWLRIASALIPGITIFHNATMTSFGPEPILNSPWQFTKQLYKGEPVAWWDQADKMPQQGPLANRELSLAGVALFTSIRDRSVAQGASRSLTGLDGLLPFPIPNPSYTPSNTRPHTVALCSPPRLEWRIPYIFEAIERIKGSEVNWLVAPEEEGVAREICGRYESVNVKIVTGRTPARWSELVKDCSVALHLHFNMYGSPAPYDLISMSHGVPVVLSDFGDSKELPDDIGIKITPGISESTAIATAIEELFALSDNERSALSVSLRAFIADYHSPQSVGGSLIHLIERAKQPLAQAFIDWRRVSNNARESLLTMTKERLGDASFRGRVEAELGWNRG